MPIEDKANNQYKRALRVITHSSLSFYYVGFFFASLASFATDARTKFIALAAIAAVSTVSSIIFLLFGDEWLFRIVAEKLARSRPILQPIEKQLLGKYHMKLTYWIQVRDNGQTVAEEHRKTVSITDDEALAELVKAGDIVERVRVGFVTIKSTLLGLKIECHNQYDDKSSDKHIVVKYWCSDFVSISEETDGLVLFFVYNIFRDGNSMAFDKGEISVNKLGIVEARRFDDRMMFRGSFADYAIIDRSETRRHGRIELVRI